MKLLFALMSALALTETSITNSLPTHSQRIEQVAVNEGRTAIEVFTDGDKEDMTCTYRYVGVAVLKQEHVRHCYGITTDLTIPAYIGVQIENNENHPIHYTVRASTVLPLK
jgi:hypothetical protein